MSRHPRTVAVSTTFMWDGAPQYLHRGRVLDVVPGGALEAAIGADRLVPLRGAPVQQAASPVPEAVPEAVPEVFGAGGGGGAAASVTAGGAGGGGTYKVTPVSPPRSRTAGKKQDNAKDGAS